MKKWETDVIVSYTRDNLLKELAKFGAEGWELVQIENIDFPGSEPSQLLAWIKRKKSEPPFTRENNPMPHIDEDLGPHNFGGTRLPSSRHD
jgi:hypothetical protein